MSVHGWTNSLSCTLLIQALICVNVIVQKIFLSISKGGQAGTCLYRFPGSHTQSFSGGPCRKGTASSPFLDAPTL